MRQFVYVSTAGDLSADDVADIVQVSQQNNGRVGLTGFLLYNGRNFLQLLEGPEAALVVLMTRLSRDRRHAGIVRLEDRPITQRVFPDWRMEHIQLSDSLAEREGQLKEAMPEGLDPEVERTVLNFARLN